jgi:hypothetical protein
MEKNAPNATKYAKWPKHIPNCQKGNKKYSNIFHSRALQKFTQIVIYGLEIWQPCFNLRT